MKKSTIGLLSLVLFIFTVISCDNVESKSEEPHVMDPSKDAFLIVEMQEDYANLLDEISKDGVITEEEIDEVIRSMEKIYSLLEMYMEDEEAANELDQVFEANEELMERMEKNERYSWELQERLMSCEGSEELERRMTEQANQAGF